MGRNVVEVILRARDLTASVLQRFQRRFRAVRRVVLDVTKAVAAGTVALAGMVFGLQRLGERGDKVIAVKRAFAKITGDETAALNRLREASKGMVDDFQLMSLANQSVALGAARSTAEFADQIEVVNKLARAQGLTLSEGLQKFTVGMARLSKLRLDDLGITLDVEKANDDFARSLGKSAAALTDNEKALAFRSAAMREARRLADAFGTAEDGASSATVRFRISLMNLRDTLARFVAESPEVAKAFDFVAQIVENVTAAVASGELDRITEAFSALGALAGNSFMLAFQEAIAAGFGALDKLVLPKFLEDRLTTVLGIFAGAAEENAEQLREAIAAWVVVLESIGRRPQQIGSGGGGGGTGVGGIGGDGGGGSGALLDIPGAGFRAAPGFFSPQSIAAFQQRRARLAAVAAGPRSLQPGSFGLAPGRASGGGPLAGLDVQALIDADTIREELDDAGDAFDETGQVVAATMFGMAQAVVRSTDQVAQSVVSMITQITQSLPGVGGIFGTIIGGVGGLIGAAFGRGGRREPVGVRIQDIDDAAARKLQGSDQPIRVTTIIEQGGVEIERIERELIDRQNRNAVVRFSPTARAGVR